MPSPKQIAASRANALKSTGPRTPSGKAASRFNALKHGIDAQQQIMFRESAADLAELTVEYHQQHNPANSAERFLVDTLINNEWRLRRLRCVEADLWRAANKLFFDKNIDADRTGLGDGFAAGTSTFERLQRVINSCERNYHRALKELQHLQAAQPEEMPNLVEPDPAAQPEEPKTASASVGSFHSSSESAPHPTSADPEPTAIPDTPPGLSPHAAA
jgi:hypothetical protein